jgi:uncharacterized YigZ family protein
MASKHLAFVYPVRTEEEIRELLDALRKAHHQANHVCYAWRLGWDMSRFRSSDDGEPSGTAGKPIFGQIQSLELTNVLVAVVRYFGGTKLGTGGLIDAYRTAARMAIEANEIEIREVMDHYLVAFPYEKMPVVMKLVKDGEMEKVRTDFQSQCELEVLVNTRWTAALSALAEDHPNVVVRFLGRS